MKKIKIISTIILIMSIILLFFQSKSKAESGTGWTTDIPMNVDIRNGLVLYTTQKDNGTVINGRKETSDFDKVDEVTIDWMLWVQRGRPGSYSQKTYDYIFDLDSGQVKMRYDSIGSYMGEDVGCYVTFSRLYGGSDDTGMGLIDISGCFYNGFYLLGTKHCNISYSFFKMSDLNKKDESKTTRLKLKNSIFSSYSLNKNEEVSYTNNSSATVYLSENSLIYRKKETIKSTKYIFWRGSSNDFTDTQTGATYKTAGVSFELKNTISTHNFVYGSHTAVGRYGMGCAWFFPSSIPIGITKISPTKSVNKTEVKGGATITYTIKQKLHKANTNILSANKYTSLAIWDTLPDETQYTSTTVKIGNTDITNDSDVGSLTVSGKKIKYTFTKDYLKNLSLRGQTVTMKIKCKVLPTDEKKWKHTFTNKAFSAINGYESESNEVTVTILPTIKNSISKSGPNVITDTQEKLTYKINYTAKIKFYKGKATAVIEDKLPFEIDTSKSSLNGGTYNSKNKTITWTETFDNISTLNTYKSFKVNKTIKVVFKNMSHTVTSFKNIVEAQMKTETPESTSDKVTAEKETLTSFKIDVKAIKKWNDTQEQKSRRPTYLVFMLLADGRYTGKSYTLSPQTKDSEEYTFSKLNKYDSKGNRINYTIIEVTKQVGETNLRLQDLKGDYITNKDDLRYYVDSEAVDQESYDKGNKYKNITITNHYVSMNIKGNVWKDTTMDGIKKNGENGFKGISAKLILITKNNGESKEEYYENYGIKYNVRTDSEGNYEFNDIPWNGTYKIRFFFNGQVYEPTYYKNDLTAGYSNVKENTTERNNINNRFATITSYPNNYDSNKRAFGLNEKIKSISTNSYIYDSSGTAITFSNILEIFDGIQNNYTEYNSDFYEELVNQIKNLGIDETTANSIISYINDCIIYSDTNLTYTIINAPTATDKNNRVNINGVGYRKTGNTNDVASVDLGLTKREVNDIAIVNDIYNVTTIINGKISNDKYNSKVEKYSETARANDGKYNGSNPYIRKIYVSDYLYNGEDLGFGAERNLQIFITYRTKIKNNGEISTIINSINNYYDKENLELSNESTCINNTFNGDQNYNQLGTIEIENKESELTGHNEYGKLNIKGTNGEALKVKHSNGSINKILHPGEEIDVYITFKVKKDTDTDKVILYRNIRNISEIDSYSSIYMSADGNKIPSFLDKNNNLINKIIVDGTPAGIVDINSDPGSLRGQDIDEKGNLIYKNSINGKENILIESDTDKIDIELQLKTEGEEEYERSFIGNIFEDNRTDTDNTGKASIGNGYCDNEETKINGVTIQLVELVLEVDEEGKPVIENGSTKYIEERVCGSYIYDENVEYKNPEDNNDLEKDTSYYSGIGKSKVIISGMGDLEIKSRNIGANNGAYAFDSMQPGDYYIRYIYGDTARTVLTNDTNNKVNVLLNNAGVDGAKGLNGKSYNGQDYKSTVYQKGVNQEIIQYNGINGFIPDYTKQNDLKLDDKSTMFYYDLAASENVIINGNKVRVSDGKDSYTDRENCINYSKTLKNDNAEILNSYEKVTSIKTDTDDIKRAKQINMIKELMSKTKMRAQTGVMDIEINHDNGTTNEIDMGLVERARSQVTLGIEIENMKFVLPNGQTLFNTSKSVRNLYYSKHQGHGVALLANKMVGYSINNEGGKTTPELIQAYIDDELLAGATMEATYKIVVKNKGEVDYKDPEFYYTGNENNVIANIVKTNAEEIVVYNTNSTKYDETKQKVKDRWKVVEPEYLLTNNLVSNKYKEEINTYDTLLISQGLNKELVPELYNEEESKQIASLVVSTKLTSNTSIDTLVYNNLSEIIKSTNEQGRKFAYSIPGNQKIVSQSAMKNLISGESREDRIVPEEIDADSSQKIAILPPTGLKDSTAIIIWSSVATVIVLIITALLLKNKLNND